MFGNAELERRLARVERKLDLIIEHLGIEPASVDTRPLVSTQGMGEIDSLLLMGKKIEAIREYRKIHRGLSLSEAVDAIEERKRALGG
ncbi:hypothetical protein [Nocardia shimofusensis]|uniref:hypothetical protein n=1 Tax=Nocardia shimofusensis TaxID=228596 RepID=UPI00082B14AD|nr:hypothetical protein [Nocardia shimofusensis]